MRLRCLGRSVVAAFALYRFFKNYSFPLQVAVELVPVSLMVWLRQFKCNLGDNRPDSLANLFEANLGGNVNAGCTAGPVLDVADKPMACFVPRITEVASKVAVELVPRVEGILVAVHLASYDAC